MSIKIVSNRSEAELIFDEMKCHIRRVAAQSMLTASGVGDMDALLIAVRDFQYLMEDYAKHSKVIDLDRLKAAVSAEFYKDNDPVMTCRDDMVRAGLRIAGHRLNGSNSGVNKAEDLLTKSLHLWEEEVSLRRKSRAVWRNP